MTMSNNEIKHEIQVGPLTLKNGGPFFAIVGPCVIENEDTPMAVARFLTEVRNELDIPIIFKSSYDKANRTSLDSFRGLGVDEGLHIIQEVKTATNLPVLSDVHQLGEIEKVVGVLDAIQIPAFLCRQTDLILAAARSGLCINIKKGQFLSPWEMEPVIQKLTSTGNKNIMITERGTTFGYNNLVVDMRSIPIMKRLGFPVVFDATHSVQLPGGRGVASGGQREFVADLSKAAVAAGADGVFLEVHPNPDEAYCDGPNSLPLRELNPLLSILKDIYVLIRS
jgi:2-dehydro-3-deoxyphosphooctonate aldolase (KDO 8-P synthase)